MWELFSTLGRKPLYYPQLTYMMDSVTIFISIKCSRSCARYDWSVVVYFSTIKTAPYIVFQELHAIRHSSFVTCFLYRGTRDLHCTSGVWARETSQTFFKGKYTHTHTHIRLTPHASRLTSHASLYTFLLKMRIRIKRALRLLHLFISELHCTASLHMYYSHYQVQLNTGRKWSCTRYSCLIGTLKQLMQDCCFTWNQLTCLACLVSSTRREHWSWKGMRLLGTWRLTGQELLAPCQVGTV